MISLLCAGCVNAANAYTISNSTTATAGITFAPVHNVGLTLTPLTSLVAGPITKGALVANGALTDSVASQLAFRFTPDTGASGKKETASIITVSGTNDPSNLITLKLEGDFKTSSSSDNAWMYTNDPMTRESLYITANAAQTVAADTYTISVDGADYAP